MKYAIFILLTIVTFKVGYTEIPVEEVIPEVTVVEQEEYIPKDIIATIETNYKYFSNKSKSGVYQFDKKTFIGLGFNDSLFKLIDSTNNIKIQDSAFIMLWKSNLYVMRNHLHYLHKEYNNIYWTKDHLLAAVHFAGPKNVKKYLKSNGEKDIEDRYGTTIKSYINKFDKLYYGKYQ